MSETTPRILIMAGGTGGHVFPALTIATELRARGAEVEWLGTRQGLEARVIGNTAIPLHFISISGLRGKSIVKKLLAPFVILLATLQAMLKIIRIRPACVLGMGGFVTGPGGVAARLLGRNLLIHEQNAIAGLSNQMLFPLARVVMEAFPGAFARTQKLSRSALLRGMMDLRKVVTVGNPVRAEILAIAPPEQRFAGRGGKLRVLVVGGSLGATAINRVLPEVLAALPERDRPLVKHQSGSRNLEETLEHYRKANLEPGGELEVLPFIDDMAAAYAWADLVLCRAGASTIAEIAAIGLPAILVPYPYAVDDHQTANGRVLEAAGAADVIQQHLLTPQSLGASLARMNDRRELLKMAQAARATSVRDATGRAADLCLEVCNG